MYANKPEVLYAVRYLLHQAIKANEAANRRGVPVIFRSVFVPLTGISMQADVITTTVSDGSNDAGRRKVSLRLSGYTYIEIVDDGQGLSEVSETRA